MPSSPSKMTQRWPHAKQRSLPFSSFSYSSPSVVNVSRTLFRVDVSVGIKPLCLLCLLWFLSSSLQNLFAERRQDQFDAEMRSFVMDIEDGIDLCNLEGNHFFCVCDHFHRQVRFTIIGVAP